MELIPTNRNFSPDPREGTPIYPTQELINYDSLLFSTWFVASEFKQTIKYHKN